MLGKLLLMLSLLVGSEKDVQLHEQAQMSAANVTVIYESLDDPGLDMAWLNYCSSSNCLDRKITVQAQR